MSLERSMNSAGAVVVVAAGIVVTLAPFVVHVVKCVQDDWATMLILGLLIPPVGWFHGVGVIFGWWG